jgi:hypothetical protein
VYTALVSPAASLEAPPRIRELDAQHITGDEDLLGALHRDELQGAILRGVYQPPELQPVVQRLLAGDPPWPGTARDHADLSRPQVRVLGEPVSPSDLYPRGPDIGHYLGRAEAFRAFCRTLFAPAPAFFERVPALLERVSGGRGVRLAHTPDGHSYGSATVRLIPPGSGLPPHCENDYMGLPIYDGLRDRVALPRKLGFLMPLNRPEGGGELVIYAQRWSAERRGSGRAAEFEHRAHHRFELDPGDLALLNVGSNFHEVRKVTGTVTRLTIGGFGAMCLNEPEFWYWA